MSEDVHQTVVGELKYYFGETVLPKKKISLEKIINGKKGKRGS